MVWQQNIGFALVAQYIPSRQKMQRCEQGDLDQLLSEPRHKLTSYITAVMHRLTSLAEGKADLAKLVLSLWVPMPGSLSPKLYSSIHVPSPLHDLGCAHIC